MDPYLLAVAPDSVQDMLDESEAIADRFRADNVRIKLESEWNCDDDEDSDDNDGPAYASFASTEGLCTGNLGARLRGNGAE